MFKTKANETRTSRTIAEERNDSRNFVTEAPPVEPVYVPLAIKLPLTLPVVSPLSPFKLVGSK